MTEYTESHSIARLIGAPPGYVGYEEGGQLTEAVRRKPYSVLLFDEIEKAHPQIFSAFLQILDDGRLTDGRGHTVNFKNTVIIMTSNLGGSFVVDDKMDEADVEAKMFVTLRENFRPEFLNRIDQIITFKRLGKDEVAKIVEIQLGELSLRLAEKGFNIIFDKSVNDYVTLFGFDKIYGARPVKRVIQNKIEDELALQIIEGRLPTGQIITVGIKDGRLSVK